MKKGSCACLLAIAILLCSCVNEKNKPNQISANLKEEASQDSITETVVTNTALEDQYLIIGGRRYDYKLSELHKVSEFTLWLQPYGAPTPIGMDKGSYSLEGIELLKNVNKLTIRGVNRYNMREENKWPDISGIDFSHLSALKGLWMLRFYFVAFDAIPDFSGIHSLDEIWFDDCIIISMDELEKNRQIRHLSISLLNNYLGDFKPISGLINLDFLRISGSVYINEERKNTVIRVADLSGLTKLRHLRMGNFNSVDFGGIKNLPSLEILEINEIKDIINIQDIAGLKNLKELTNLSISSNVLSLDFLGSMTSLSELDIYGSGKTIDITPLKNLSNLENLGLYNFTITNFHVLDEFPKLEKVFTIGSKFYPENNNRLKNAGVYYVHDR